MGYLKDLEKLSLSVRKRRQKIEDKHKIVDALFENLQDSCPHVYLRYVCWGSTGNWDREDSFGAYFHCPDCQKRLSTSQGQDMKDILKKYPHASKIDFYSDANKHSNFYNDKLFAPYKEHGV
jgi:hypothetical protein